MAFLFGERAEFDNGKEKIVGRAAIGDVPLISQFAIIDFAPAIRNPAMEILLSEWKLPFCMDSSKCNSAEHSPL